MLERTKELKKEIMREIKKQGWTSKDVSIKTSEGLTSTTFDFVIKTTNVDYKKLEKIANKYQDFEFDSMQDLHVSGRYICFVKLDNNLEKIVEEEQQDKISEIIKDLYESVKNKVSYKDIKISKHIKINVSTDKNNDVLLLVRNDKDEMLRQINFYDRYFESIESTSYFFKGLVVETMTKDLVNYF